MGVINWLRPVYEPSLSPHLKPQHSFHWRCPPATPAPEAQEIKIELRKGGLSMVVTWPLNAAADFASWTTAILK